MSDILLVDCSPKMTQAISKLLRDTAKLRNAAFEEKMNLNDCRMIILASGDDHDYIVNQIRKLRYSCNFRDIPIILIKQNENHNPIQTYIIAGATEVLDLSVPTAAYRQIIQGYMIPGRQPLAEEMKYLNPFIQNTQNVLETMASMESKFQDVYFSKDFRIFGDISGIIGLSGESEGTVAVTFYWNLARRIIAEMMNVGEDEINADLIHDGVGELINMIAGSTKKDLVGSPCHFELSLPSVVVGQGHQIGHPEDASIAVMIFDVASNAFALQVGLRPK